MDNNQALPIWLQIAVDLAAIISSVGVIAAFIQIYISTKQFKEQLKITQNQLKLSEDQFTLINQGYLSPEFEVSLYSPDIKAGTAIAPNSLWQILTTNVSLNNTGNLPIVFTVMEFNLYFNGVKTFSLSDNQVLTPATTYPKQISPYVINAPLKVDHTCMSIEEVIKTEITSKIVIHYHDFNSKRIKIINRSLKYYIDFNIYLTSYLDISDSI
jgi:hypothetical protein